MPRAVFLIIYNSPLFPAHWSLWVPQSTTPNIGTRIHATGDAATGFEVAFERNYDISTDTRRHQILPLAQVSDDAVVDVIGDGKESTDQEAHDELERVALDVPAPGPSLMKADVKRPRSRVDIQNCQTWLRQVVEAYVKKGIMDQDAVLVIDSAPKN